MVALDVQTGKLKWWYQMVHHDIWDYDAPSPTILFDAKMNGKDVQGIGEAEKTGWVYLLNRGPGKPLFPTPEQTVPQNVNQKTWPTQPIPSYQPVVPHEVSDEQYQAVVKAAKTLSKGAAGEGDPGHGDVHALLEDDDRVHAGAAGRHELAAVELQPEHAPVLRLRAERRHRQHRRRRAPRRSRATSRRSRSAAR